MASNMHNTRLLRFLIVVSIVVLTIFIYASYSSTQTLAPPPMRNTAMASLMAFSMANKSSSGAGSIADALEPVASANVKNNRAAPPYIRYENLPSAGGGGGSHGNDVVVIKKLTHHREPTIDENAIDGGGSDGPDTDVGAAGETGTGGAEDLALGVGGGVGDDTALDHFNNQNNDLMQEEQYVQVVENNLVNINNSAASAGSGTGAGEMKQQQQQQQQSPEGQQSQQQQQQQAQQNKISDSDVLIPTSNLQKFIESADKILKNISSQHHVVATADTINKSPDKYYLPLDPNNDDNEILDDNDEAQQPSVIMTIKGGAGDILSNINNKDSEKIADDNKNNNKNEAAKQVASAAISSASAAGAGAAPSSASSAKTTATTKKAATKVQSADPTQGIPTQQIYEPGHMNEEIDIEQICPNKGDKLKLLILITSAQTHTEARLAIRQTWGHFGTRRDVSTAFILGRTTNATINEALTQENMIYGDLIRGHFIDSYNNLTLKTLSSLEWVDNHCPKAKYILKTDDDMFINVPKLLQFLDAHAKDKRVIYGRLAKKWKPIRNKKSKYYISTGQFNAAVFPPFTTGPAYVLTSDIVHELYVRSLHQVYLKLEDVFTTGIVAQQLGIKRVHVNEFLNRRIAFNPCNIRKSISVHMIKANEQFDLWKKLLDQTTKCK
uniref:Galactosyltransferase n=1 Tax=Musca domestica TaxID=7370 RepID=A0A1I8MPA0_MUSDO